MKSKTAVKIRMGLALAILLLVVAVVVFSGYFEDQSEFDLEFSDIKVENPKPSLLSSRVVTIDPGESVTLCVTVQNNGEEIIYRDTYGVGIEVVYPKEGDKYWNRKEKPFTGNFKIHAYIRSIQTDNKLARSGNVTVVLKPPQ